MVATAHHIQWCSSNVSYIRSSEQITSLRCCTVLLSTTASIYCECYQYMWTFESIPFSTLLTTNSFSNPILPTGLGLHILASATNQRTRKKHSEVPAIAKPRGAEQRPFNQQLSGTGKMSKVSPKGHLFNFGGMRGGFNHVFLFFSAVRKSERSCRCFRWVEVSPAGHWRF